MENISASLKDQILTVKQSQEYMKCSRTLIWKIRKEGLIKTANVGKKVLLIKSSLDQYMKINQEVFNG